jgi:hypothetical protein
MDRAEMCGEILHRMGLKVGEDDQAFLLVELNRLALEIHAYTNDSARHILDVMEKVAQKYPIANLRWDIAHIWTGTADTFARMKALGSNPRNGSPV